MADNSDLDKMRLAAMMNKSPATGGLKATNTVTPSFSMNTPIEQAYSRWKQGNSIAARQLRGEQMSAEDIAKDLNYQLEAAMKDPTNFMGTIKAVGNLNLVPRIAKETLRGPETQTLQSFMNQVKQTPGVTKEGAKSALAKLQYITPEAKMTKAEFEKEINPSKYQKVDLATRSDDIREHFRDTVENAMDDYDVYRKMGLSEELRDHAADIMYGGGEMHHLPKDIQKKFKKLGYYDVTSLEDAFMMQKEEMIDDGIAYLMEMEGHDPDAMNIGEPSYKYIGQQRLTPKEVPNKYFELGVSHPEQREAYRHYNDPDTPPGLIGHVRGSHITEPTPLVTGSRNQVWTNPGESVIEEIQSDAQKIADQTGHLHQVHGTLTKAAIQDALEKGSHTVYVPTSRAIGAVRGTPGGEYSSIYDDAIIREALGPLQQVPGVKITPPTETPYSYPWTKDALTDAYNYLGIPHSQHESARIFHSAPTGGKDRLANRSQNLRNLIDADQTTVDVLRNMENPPWYMEDKVKDAADNQARYDAHQNFIKWIDEKYPETPGNNDLFEQGQSFNEAIKAVAQKRQDELWKAKTSETEMPYHKIEFSPEAVEHILKGPGQTAPGYKAGGSVDMDKIRYALAMRKAEGGAIQDPNPPAKGTPLARHYATTIGAKEEAPLEAPMFSPDDLIGTGVGKAALGLGLGTIKKIAPESLLANKLYPKDAAFENVIKNIQEHTSTADAKSSTLAHNMLYDNSYIDSKNYALSKFTPEQISAIRDLLVDDLRKKLPTLSDNEVNKLLSWDDKHMVMDMHDVLESYMHTPGVMTQSEAANVIHKLRNKPYEVLSDYIDDAFMPPYGAKDVNPAVYEQIVRNIKANQKIVPDKLMNPASKDIQTIRALERQEQATLDYIMKSVLDPETKQDMINTALKNAKKKAQGGPVHMAGGGQPNNKFSYSSKLADLAGLDEEYRNANTIPLEHYPKSTEHNGPADAMRHMLFQAQLTKNYNPTLAKIISQGHERLLDWGQPDAEQAMDFHNDALGREIGTKAQSIEEMTQMAKDAIASGRAKTINRDLPGKYYKVGGKVKKVSTTPTNHGNIALTTAQMRANLMRKKHG